MSFSTGAIAGMAAGSVGLLALAASGCYFFGRKGSRFKKRKAKMAEAEQPSTPRDLPGELLSNTEQKSPSAGDRSPYVLRGTPVSPGAFYQNGPYHQMYGPSPPPFVGEMYGSSPPSFPGAHPGAPYSSHSPNGTLIADPNGTMGSNV